MMEWGDRKRGDRSRPVQMSLGSDGVVVLVVRDGMNVAIVLDVAMSVIRVIIRIEGDFTDPCRAQRFRQPACVGQQSFGLGRHIPLFKMFDHHGLGFAAALTHGLEYARLRAPCGYLR
mgnify:CR=1 FL=1